MPNLQPLYYQYSCSFIPIILECAPDIHMDENPTEAAVEKRLGGKNIQGWTFHEHFFQTLVKLSLNRHENRTWLDVLTELKNCAAHFRCGHFFQLDS